MTKIHRYVNTKLSKITESNDSADDHIFQQENRLMSIVDVDTILNDSKNVTQFITKLAIAFRKHIYFTNQTFRYVNEDQSVEDVYCISNRKSTFDLYLKTIVDTMFDDSIESFTENLTNILISSVSLRPNVDQAFRNSIGSVNSYSSLKRSRRSKEQIDIDDLYNKYIHEATQLSQFNVMTPYEFKMKVIDMLQHIK